MAGLWLQKRSDLAKKSKEGWASGDKGNLWVQGKKKKRWKWLQRPKSGVDCSGGRWVACDIHKQVWAVAWWVFLGFFLTRCCSIIFTHYPWMQRMSQQPFSPFWCTLSAGPLMEPQRDQSVRQQRVKRMKRPPSRWVSACECLCKLNGCHRRGNI